MYSLTPPTITGDHFKLASQFRAATATTLPQGCSRHVGINIPGESWGGRPFYRMMIMGLPHCIMVNAHGRRFGAESFFHTYSRSIYEDRQRVVEGKSVPVRVDLGGRRTIEKKKNV